MILDILAGIHQNKKKHESRNLINLKRKINSMKKLIQDLSSEEQLELLDYFVLISIRKSL